MDSDNLFEAMKMFQQGVREFSFTNALNQANDAVRQVKESTLKDVEKNSQLQQIANQMVGYMATQGLPATTIQQISQSLAPPRAASLVDALRSGDTATVSAYTEADKIQKEDEIKQMQKKAEIDAEAQGRLFEQQQKLAYIKENGKTAGKTVTDDQVNKISNVLAAEKGFQGLLSQLAKDKSLVGPLDQAAPQLRAKFDKKFAKFKTQSKRLFDQYRQAITGAGASVQELKLLEQSFPVGDETEDAYKAKVAATLEAGQQILQSKMGVLSAAGYYTSGLEQLIGGGTKPQTPAGTPDWVGFIKKR